MRNLLLLSFFITTLTSFGQQKVTIKTYFKPSKVYKTTMKMSSEAEMNFAGNQEKVDKIKAKAKLPMIIAESSEMTTTMTTGMLTADKTIPAKITYGKVVATQSMNGTESTKEKPISGLIIECFYNEESKLTIDTLISDKLDQRTIQGLKETLENV